MRPVLRPPPIARGTASFIVATVWLLGAVPAATAQPDLAIAEHSVRPSIRIGTPDSCEVAGLCATGPGIRKQLRFDTRIQNVGTASLHLGDPASQPELFEFDGCHGHYHFTSLGRYDLMPAAGGAPVVGRTFPFCLEDDIKWDAAAPDPTYSCEFQGLTWGWEDVRYAGFSCQWLDVTGVPDGDYVLRVSVNPDRVLEESNYENNVECVPVRITGDEVVALPKYRLILYDRTASMTSIRSATGNTRCNDVQLQARRDIQAFRRAAPESRLAVWTFNSTTGVVDATSGFVTADQAAIVLDNLDSEACAGATPVVDAICAAGNALQTSFPSAIACQRELVIYSDGGENVSSGACSGPGSVAGPPFDSGSWQEKVTAQIAGQAVALVYYWGAPGSAAQSWRSIDGETGLWKNAALVSDAVFFENLAVQSGGRYVLADDANPRYPLPQIPIMPAMTGPSLALAAALFMAMGAWALMRRRSSGGHDRA